MYFRTLASNPAYDASLRHVIVWNHNHTAFLEAGSYRSHVEGKQLLLEAKRAYPDHMIERVTDKSFQYLTAAA